MTMERDLNCLKTAYSKFELVGKTALVTGGGTGLGYYMARGLARSGAKVMIAARRAEVLKEAAQSLMAEAPGSEVIYTTMDLNDRSSVEQLKDDAIAGLGGVDIFVGNAAQDDPEPIGFIKDETIDRLLQVNVAANIRLTQFFLPHMIEKQWGRIIYSSSIGSKKAAADVGTSVYGACKSALNAYARLAAAEVGHHNITANSIIIGLYQSVMFDDALRELEESQGPEVAKALYDSFATMTALSRIGQPEELEGVIQLLASEAGRNISGTEFTVDGGMDIMMKPKVIP
jgi:NAD(P)-dependent dehydrogenase (short-subunit alcohol dehydrogenase family)